MPGAVIKNVRILTRLVLLRYYEIGVPLVNMNGVLEGRGWGGVGSRDEAQEEVWG